jgi:hypothetical protein
MGKSIYDCHVEVVECLKKKGETILQPLKSEPWIKNGTRIPDIYVKGYLYPSKDFIIGHGIIEKDGSISIHGDFLSWEHNGFKLDDLGLCDPACVYENSNLLREADEELEKIKLSLSKVPTKDLISELNSRSLNSKL